MSHIKWLKIGFTAAVLYCFFFQTPYLYAQSTSKGKKKKDVSLLRKGFDDLTTRNNYYFNAKLIYDEMVKNHLLNRQLNYSDTLPFYFHDGNADFAGNAEQIKNIIIKTGITLQRHDYARWKDDCYHLMGRAYFLQGNIDTALQSFQYVTTTMRGKFNNKKVVVSQKQILKAKMAKKKEMDKLAESKKRAAERKQKEKKAETEKSIAEKQKRIDVAAAQKQKDLQKRIKEKEKMIKQKAKGKYKAPATTAKKTTPSTPSKSKDKKSNSKKAGNIMDKISEGVSIEFKGKEGNLADAHKAVGDFRQLEAQKKASEIGNVEDSLTQKEIEKLDQLTLWEKIKHHPKRAQAIVWLTKSFLAKGEFENAQSMVEYSNTLKKLRREDKKELKLIKSYYYYKTGQHDKSAEVLSEALPHIKKKKDKAYYSFLLAQLTENNNPQAAYDTYLNVRKIGKDEKTDFYALEKMRHLITAGKITEPDMESIVKAYKSASKSKALGDKALYAMAEMAILEKDTLEAIQQLKKSIAFLSGDKDQKTRSLVKLGEIYYSQGLYAVSYELYDSAKTILPAEFPQKSEIENKHARLQEIVKYAQIHKTQDSLLYLSTLSREELSAYIRDQNKFENKQKRKSARESGEDAAFSSTGLGDNANFDVSQEKYSAKGQWYFYNTDLRTRGFNEFKQQWGDRSYVNNWRRLEATRMAAQAKVEEEKVPEKEKEVIAPVTQLKIPSTDEEIQLAHDGIEQSFLGRGKVFFEGLNDFLPSLTMLDSVLTRYPKGKSVPEALYYQMLILKEQKKDQQAQKIADKLVTEFPESEWAKKLSTAKAITKDLMADNTQDDADILYASLYTSYENGAYNEVIRGKKFFAEKFSSQKALMPKVTFLEAISLAKQGEMELYKRSLNEIITNYPKSPEAVQAKLYLSSLIEYEKEQAKKAKEENPDAVTDEKIETASNELFKYQEGFHFVMITIKEKKHSSASITQSLNQLMESEFPSQRIKATNSFLDATTPMILIKRFNNIAEANKAILSIKNSADPAYKEFNEKADILLISQDNFKELFTNKKLEDYKAFYKKYYN